MVLSTSSFVHTLEALACAMGVCGFPLVEEVFMTLSLCGSSLCFEEFLVYALEAFLFNFNTLVISLSLLASSIFECL